jgi:type I restriction enzyme, S subunit
MARGATTTGGRSATTRHIPGDFAISVGMPKSTPPRGWNWVELTSLARLESGHTPSRGHTEYWNGDIPWIGIQDAKANHGSTIINTTQTTNALGIANSSARVLPAGTVCLSRTASVGYVTIMGRAMATSQDFVNWICGEKLLSHFLAYLLIAENRSLFKFASGAVHQTIYYPEVKAFHICIPSVAEQKRIVAILDESLQGIAAAVANAERNLSNARELFESYLDSVFNQKGHGWTTMGLEKAGRLQTGTTPKTSEKGNLGTYIPFIKPGDFRPDGSLDYENEGLSELGLAQSRLIPAGSALMVCIGATIGKSGFAVQDISANQQVNAVTPFAGISGKLIYYQMTSRRFQDEVIANSAQATLPIINKSKWGRLIISLPKEPAEQQRIVSKLDKLSVEIQRLENIYRQKLNALAELKRSIFEKAFAGELTAQPERLLQEALA